MRWLVFEIIAAGTAVGCSLGGGTISRPNGNSCAAAEHSDGAACASNSAICSVANGRGQMAWLSQSSQWGACLATSCNDGFANVGGSCIPAAGTSYIEMVSAASGLVTTSSGYKASVSLGGPIEQLFGTANGYKAQINVEGMIDGGNL